jgi:predicted NBD/HSP70 family sugar kinase
MSSAYSINEAAGDLDRALDHLRAAADQLVHLIGTEQGPLTDRILDRLGEVRPSAEVLRVLFDDLDELALARGEG